MQTNVKLFGSHRLRFINLMVDFVSLMVTLKMKLPKPSEGSAWYQGKFESPAFKLWGGRTGLSERLYNVLKDFGATSQDFTIEGSAGSSALAFNVLKSNFVVRIKLDGFETTFHSLNSIGAENATKIGIGCWQAIKESSSETNLLQHELTMAFQFPVKPKQYTEIIAPFMTVPKSLPANTLPGFAFYLPSGQRTGDRGGSIVLDRLVAGTDLYLTVRVQMIIDAIQVGVPVIAKYIDDYTEDVFSKLGIEIEH